MSEFESPPREGDSGQWRRWRMGELDHGSQAASLEHRLAAEQQRQRQYRSDLEAERQRVLEQARREGYEQGLAAGREAGHTEGLVSGREAGRESCREQTRDVLAPMSDLLQTFHDALQDLDDLVADELVELALETGRQLAGEALKARPRQVLQLVQKLLHEEPLLTGQPRLWLHPRDLALVADELGEEFAAAGWTLQPDEMLSRGGCRVTCASGELDATHESRWQAVMARVRRTRSGRPTAAREKR